MLLSNGDGEHRCAWEPLGEGYDCSQLCPTTTTTTTQEPGCYGDSAASNKMCAVFDADDADKCRRAGARLLLRRHAQDQRDVRARGGRDLCESL